MDCTASAPERIRISVKDTGAGLPPEKLAQLFQPFNRLGQESSAEEGTGIGLVVSKRLVELMGGVIGVESTVGVGSVFWFELISAAAPQLAFDSEPKPRLRPDRKLPARRAAAHPALCRGQPGQPEAGRATHRAPPRHAPADRGERNLGIELARDHQPEVILMDINLPGISGIEALKILREDPATAHIPVVALSANAMPRDIEKGLEAGFFRYLTKPIKVNEFMDTLNVALEFSEKAVRQSK